MKILVACEFSGIVRDAFIARGHNAVSCDLLPTEKPGPHYQGDVRDILYAERWDLIIAFPPCTYLTTAANSYLRVGENGVEKVYTRYILRVLAIEFFMLFIDHPCPKIAIENPRGIMSTIYRKPNQYLCHTDHGERWTKKTGLWLKGLPPLMATKKMQPEFIRYGKNQKEKSPLTANKGVRKRCLIPAGLARAMAEQWC